MAAYKYTPGNIIDTPKGKIKIISVKPGKRLNGNKRIHPRAVIEFLNTGTVLDVQSTNIACGKFSDYRLPTVYGVGYIGSTLKIPSRENPSIIRRIYDLWANMLKRAYGNYKTCYVGITVDRRWHNFTHFLNTIQNVPGYSEWEKNEKAYVLDKDIKVKGNKTYSMDTCLFVPATENVRESSLRRWHGNNASV